MADNNTISFDSIQFHPSIPNVRFALGDVDGLAKSIHEQGLITPLLVLREKNGRKTDHFLVSGHRRYEAVKRLRAASTVMQNKFEDIEVTFFDGTLSDALFVNIAENLNRQSLSPMEVADRIQDFVNSGLEQQEVAKKLGRSAAWVSQILSVNKKATTGVKSALSGGQIKTSHAKELTRLPSDKQDAALEEFLQGSMTLAELRKLVDARLGEKNLRLRPTSEIQAKLEEVKEVIEDPKAKAKAKQEAAVWADALCWASQIENPMILTIKRRQAAAKF